MIGLESKRFRSLSAIQAGIERFVEEANHRVTRFLIIHADSEWCLATG